MKIIIIDDEQVLLDQLKPAFEDQRYMVETAKLVGTGDKIKGLDLGADDYLPKPFSLDELMAQLMARVRAFNIRLSPVLFELPLYTMEKVPIVLRQPLKPLSPDFPILMKSSFC